MQKSEPVNYEVADAAELAPTFNEKQTLNILSSRCSEKPGFLPKHFGNPGLQRRNGGFWIVFSGEVGSTDVQHWTAHCNSQSVCGVDDSSTSQLAVSKLQPL